MPERLGKIHSFVQRLGKLTSQRQSETPPSGEQKLSVLAEHIYQEVLTTVVQLIRQDVDNKIFYPEDAYVLTMLLKEERAAAGSVIRQNPIGLEGPQYPQSSFPAVYERVRERSLQKLKRLNEKPELSELTKLSDAMSKLAGVGFRYTIMRFERKSPQLHPIEWIISASIPERVQASLELQFFFIPSQSSTTSLEEFEQFVKKSPRRITDLSKNPTINQFQMTVNGKKSLFNWVFRLELDGKQYQVYYASTKENLSKPSPEAKSKSGVDQTQPLGLAFRPKGI